MFEISVWALFFIVYFGVMWIIGIQQLRKLQRSVACLVMQGEKTAAQPVTAPVTPAVAPVAVPVSASSITNPAFATAVASTLPSLSPSKVPGTRLPLRQFNWYYVEGIEKPFTTLAAALNALPGTYTFSRDAKGWRDLPSDIRAKIRKEKLPKRAMRE